MNRKQNSMFHTLGKNCSAQVLATVIVSLKETDD